jgi:DNA-binding LacI/PurR family transcriptional regulator
MLLQAVLDQGGSAGDLHVYSAANPFGLNEESYLFMNDIDGPFAVISSGFWTGRETLRLCSGKQLTPKRDFVLIDCSGLPESENLQMSSLKIDFKEIGETLVKVLEQQWQNRSCETGNKLVTTSLTVRNS